MTDQEFEQKVADLREAFKTEMLAAIGGQNAFAVEDDQAFLDAFSISAHACMSVMATLSSVLMSRYTFSSGFTPNDSAKAVDIIFHEFFHEILDAGEQSFLGNVQQYKNFKTSN